MLCEEKEKDRFLIYLISLEYPVHTYLLHLNAETRFVVEGGGVEGGGTIHFLPSTDDRFKQAISTGGQ